MSLVLKKIINLVLKKIINFVLNLKLSDFEINCEFKLITFLLMTMNKFSYKMKLEIWIWRSFLHCKCIHIENVDIEIVRLTSGTSTVVLTTWMVGMSSSDSCTRGSPFLCLPFDFFFPAATAAFFLRLFWRSSSCSRAIFMYLSDDERPD